MLQLLILNITANTVAIIDSKHPHTNVVIDDPFVVSSLLKI